ncbi:hypothetical protein A1O7_09838 [Cladophialophora yegresii CBS 114405]|uniref:Uncharacterized protein n=1 Tax=Cladophialophora yegresii CBS 114405 TaxID=1182544 RepID=W9VG94_9EURO|nr:uncharacterized protein A1O7_09838 [Cladophialophora yegresii CBS 114405]EXJ54498.1 hypothetical protein A1O7_09838 [Cladophialophora yegresii CBS 114405]
MKPLLLPLGLLLFATLSFTPVLVPARVRVHALPIQESPVLRAIDASLLETLAQTYTAYLDKKQEGTTHLLSTIDDFIASTKLALTTDFELTRDTLVEALDLLRASNAAQAENNEVGKRSTDVQQRSLAIQERTLQLAEKSNRDAVEQIITA